METLLLVLFFIGTILVTKFIEDLFSPWFRPVVAQIQEWAPENRILLVLIAGLYALVIFLQT